MSRTNAGLTAIALVLVAAVALPLVAKEQTEDDQDSLKIGDPAPAWEELEGVDGEQHSLADLEESRAVVVVFTCNHCPVAKAYEDRLIELHDAYAEQGVSVVAINVNNLKADRMPAMQKRAKEKGFEFAYLYDPSQEIGRAFQATVTPHAYVLDGERNVVYMGAIDDSMKPDKVEQQYVCAALDAVLAEQTVETAETKPIGCGIKYE